MNVIKGRTLVALGALLTTAGANAAVIFVFGPALTGPGLPIQPAGRVTITDDGPNQVNVFVENLVNPAMYPTSSQFISELALNTDPFPASGRSAIFASPVTGVTWSQDKNNSGYKLDVEIDFATSAGTRLGPGMSTNLKLIGHGLVESHFLASSPGHPTVFGLMHVQSTINGESIKLKPVPEPATMFGLAAGAGLLLRRKRK